MALKSFPIKCIALLASLSQAADKPSLDTPDADNPFMSYATSFSTINNYARSITSPLQCFGDNLEVFDQLQSPEWQLCLVEDTGEGKQNGPNRRPPFH